MNWGFEKQRKNRNPENGEDYNENNNLAQRGASKVVNEFSGSTTRLRLRKGQ